MMIATQHASRIKIPKIVIHMNGMTLQRSMCAPPTSQGFGLNYYQLNTGATRRYKLELAVMLLARDRTFHLGDGAHEPLGFRGGTNGAGGALCPKGSSKESKLNPKTCRRFRFHP